MYPENGGTLRYLAHSFQKPRLMVSYLFSWSMIMLIAPASSAANGPVFAQYWLYAIFGGPNMKNLYPKIFENIDWISRGMAFILILLITAINMLSVKWSLRFINVLTVIKICVLTVICFTGILCLVGAIKFEKNNNWSNGFKGAESNLGAYASALNKVFFSYDGWSSISYSVGEMKNPAKKLPISATMAVLSVSIFYTLSVISYFTVVPLETVANAKEVLAAEFTSVIFGTVTGRIVLPIFIGLSVVGSIAAEIFSIGRVVSSAAKLGFLPDGRAKLATYHPNLKTPIRALAFNLFLTTIFLFAPPPGDVFSLLVDFFQYPTWMFYGLAAVGCVYLRFKYPNHPNRKYKAFLPLTICFIFVTCYMCVFPFFPFSKSDSTYPYYLAPVLGISSLIIGLVPFYLRMYWYADKHNLDFTSWAKEDHSNMNNFSLTTIDNVSFVTK
ncbi:High-affinity methionine permease [Smittium culicis]|uniref:High-affinity methionine permease n=1 Tax=Smittium culicis TaxID=133412 RepID=A0A1R1YJA7_9FUNG|nr:High-affinity methionine permease [Smittium culicis]